MTTIFTVTERYLDDLFTLLVTNGHDVLEHTPGFLGSTLTLCDDGRHIVHHAGWRDDDALAALLANPAAQAGMAAARVLAEAQIFRSHRIEGFDAS